MPVVPTKLPNKAGFPVAEVVEGRGVTKGNTGEQNASWTQSQANDAPNALTRVRQAAMKNGKERFTALFGHLTLEGLRKAFLSLKRGAAAGVDGVRWEHYEQELQNNLVDLHGRLHQGAYRARPSRRVFIPKADGRQRPLGIASLEDKIVQRAVTEVMNAVYEVDFAGFSYGFRPNRSQHQALDALATAICRKKVNYVLDADIRGFFDEMDHEWLLKFVEYRVGDKRLLRLIQKWLSAGVMEAGERRASKQGTPQGATISPLLANVYLHYALDLWVEQWRKRYASGDMSITRYADDFIVGFQYRKDAERFHAELSTRLGRFALRLHPEKTRLLEFGRYAIQRRQERNLGRPETFDFLGFTHICGRSKVGKYLLIRRTMRKRMRMKLKELKFDIMRRRHLPIEKQGKWLGAVVRGYFAYYSVPTNVHRMQAFRAQLARHWLFALRRRSQHDRTNWARLSRYSERWLPSARVLHPWPTQRFERRTRGRSPVR